MLSSVQTRDTFENLTASLRQKRVTHTDSGSRKAVRQFFGDELSENLCTTRKDPIAMDRFQGVGNSGKYDDAHVRQIILAGNDVSLVKALQDSKTTRDDVLESVMLLNDILCIENPLLDSERQRILKLRNTLITLIGPTKTQADQIFGPNGAAARELLLKQKVIFKQNILKDHLKAKLPELIEKCDEVLGRVNGDAWRNLRYPVAKATLAQLISLESQVQTTLKVLGDIKELTRVREMYLPLLKEGLANMTRSVEALQGVGWK